MTDSAQDTPVSTMDDFVAKYGGIEALDDKTGTPQDKPAVPQDQPPEEGEADLNLETLQALGLVPDDEPPAAPGQAAEESDEGTNSKAVDLAHLAQTLGLDQEDLVQTPDGFQLKTKVDGEEAQVSLAELRKGYQLQKHFTKQNEEFLRQKQEWEQARVAREQQLNDQVQMAAQVLEGEEGALNKQYSRDWDTLRQEDPAEYAAQVAEYNQKLALIRQRKQGLHQQIEQKQQEYFQGMRQRQMEEGQKLAQALKWKDRESFQKGSESLRSYLVTSVGLQDKEIDGIVDHRTLIVADKARRYDELMSRVDLARKKVSTPHKTPTGTASKPVGGKKRKLAEAKKRLSSDHSLEAAADVFQNLGIV